MAGPLDDIHDYVLSGFELEVVALQAPGLGRAPIEDGVVTCRLELL